MDRSDSNTATATAAADDDEDDDAGNVDIAPLDRASSPSNDVRTDGELDTHP